MDALTKKEVHDTESLIVKAYFQQNAFNEFDGLLPASTSDRVIRNKEGLTSHYDVVATNDTTIETPSRRRIRREGSANEFNTTLPLPGGGEKEVELSPTTGGSSRRGRISNQYRQDSIPRSEGGGNDTTGAGAGASEEIMVDIDDLPDNVEDDGMYDMQYASEVPLPRRGRRSSFNEIDFHKKNPLRGQLLSYFMKSLDKIVNEPFLYFAKRPDPVSLHLAMEYIANNELNDTIYIVHFADDRELCKISLKEAGITTSLTNTIEPTTTTIAGDVEHSEHTNNNSDDDDKSINEDELKYREILLQHMSMPTFRLSTDDNGMESYNHGDNNSDHDSNKANGEGNDDMFIYESQGTKLRSALPSDARRLVDYVSILDTFYT